MWKRKFVIEYWSDKPLKYNQADVCKTWYQNPFSPNLPSEDVVVERISGLLKLKFDQ